MRWAISSRGCQLYLACIALGAVTLLLSAACTPSSQPASADPNVLLIVLDSVSAKHVGETPTSTPSIERLAAQGATFQRAYSPAPWTQPAVASLMTAQMPSGHGRWRPKSLRGSLIFK